MTSTNRRGMIKAYKILNLPLPKNADNLPLAILYQDLAAKATSPVYDRHYYDDNRDSFIVELLSRISGFNPNDPEHRKRPNIQFQDGSILEPLAVTEDDGLSRYSFQQFCNYYGFPVPVGLIGMCDAEITALSFEYLQSADLLSNSITDSQREARQALLVHLMTRDTRHFDTTTDKEVQMRDGSSLILPAIQKGKTP